MSAPERDTAEDQTAERSEAPSPFASPADVPASPAPQAAASQSSGAIDLAALPPLGRDRSFLGMLATQLLGAFNDNIYKQLILLIATVAVVGGAANAADTVANSKNLQAVAMGVFSLPFILFSGFGGYLSDRFSKRTIIILCKLAEITTMSAATVVFFYGGGLTPLLVVLFFMGTQSAFFGPAKYGILPEMVRGRDLPSANGWIQMTTFLAIIFGTAAAGFLKEQLEGVLWLCGLVCVGIGVAGTITALWIRRLPPARPGLKFTPSSLLIQRETWRMIRADPPLWWALIVYSLFWMIGGVVQPAVNALAIRQLGENDLWAAIMVACLGLGIALGCVAAGVLSAGKVSFRMARLGAVGIFLCAVALSITLPDGRYLLGYWGALAVMVLLGTFAGLMAVPLQVYLQSRPAEGQKGRMIGAMNLFNWIAIFISAGIYELCVRSIRVWSLPESTAFAVAAALMLPVVLFYRPANEEL